MHRQPAAAPAGWTGAASAKAEGKQPELCALKLCSVHTRAAGPGGWLLRRQSYYADDHAPPTARPTVPPRMTATLSVSACHLPTACR